MIEIIEEVSSIITDEINNIVEIVEENSIIDIQNEDDIIEIYEFEDKEIIITDDIETTVVIEEKVEVIEVNDTIQGPPGKDATIDKIIHEELLTNGYTDYFIFESGRRLDYVYNDDFDLIEVIET